MSEERPPIWQVPEPIQPYPDGRFDGPAIPDASTPVWSSEMGMTPPLDPQQPTPRTRAEAESDISAMVRDERIADAARLAVPNIETVFRLYGHIQTHPLPELRALLDMLTPPAPKWTATEEEDE